MAYGSTFHDARALGGGCVLSCASGAMFRVDNWSPGTGQVWGREITGGGSDYAAGEMIELRDDLKARVYVLGGCTNAMAWVLSLEPCSIVGGERKIAWQRVGQGQFDPAGYWRLATWDAALCRFIVEGQPVDVSEGPYTEAAWSDFTRALPGVGDPDGA